MIILPVLPVLPYAGLVHKNFASMHFLKKYIIIILLLTFFGVGEREFYLPNKRYCKKQKQKNPQH